MKGCEEERGCIVVAVGSLHTSDVGVVVHASQQDLRHARQERLVSTVGIVIRRGLYVVLEDEAESSRYRADQQRPREGVGGRRPRSDDGEKHDAQGIE
jgi:hypothetical protein